MPAPSFLRLYGSRRMAALLGLGFASGLPLALTSDAMTGWLASEQVKSPVIGLFALVGLPYTLKVFWAPAMDRFQLGGRLRRLGRRRSWLLVTQLLIALATAAMAMVNPSRSTLAFAIAAMLLSFFSASQDVVADAYRSDVLPAQEMGAGAALFVNGYRIAMLVSGGSSLILADRVGWSATYLMMAALMGVGLLATWLAPIPQDDTPPTTFVGAVIDPLHDFFASHRGRALIVLAFILLFKLPDVMAGWQTIPFLTTHLEYSKSDVGIYRQWVGTGMTIVGTLCGGYMVAKLGLLRSLWVMGGLQTVSNAGFLALGLLTTTNIPVLVIVMVIESFCGGLVTAGFVAFLMSQCTRQYSATQYALLTSFMALTGVISRTPTGYIIESLGWIGFFVVTIALGIPGMLMLLALPESTFRNDVKASAETVPSTAADQTQRQRVEV